MQSEKVRGVCGVVGNQEGHLFPLRKLRGRAGSLGEMQEGHRQEE